MNKLGVAAAATGITGTTATAVYGIYSLEAFGDSEANPQTIHELTGDIQGEKAKYANECLKEIFQDATVDDNLPLLNSTFTGKNSSAKINACLVYNGKKEKRDQNYKGSNFRLVWTISKGDEGVALYLAATVKDDKKIEFDGLSYVFEKQADGKWKAIQKLGLQKGSKMTLSSHDEGKSKFPKVGSEGETNSFKRKFKINDYWEFLDDNGSKVKDSGENIVSDSNLWWKWKLSEGGVYQLKNGSKNFDTGWNYFFGKDKLDMMKLMESESVGSGE